MPRINKKGKYKNKIKIKPKKFKPSYIEIQN